MPIYGYECGNCHFRFERRQGFDEEPEAMCPQCHGKSRRVFYPSAIVFKGSGFYITDSRKSSGVETGKQKRKATPKKEAKGEKGNEGTAPAGEPGLG